MVIIKNNIKIIVGIIIGILFSGISVYALNLSSSSVEYDNSSSGLTSTNVKDAIDELYRLRAGNGHFYILTSNGFRNTGGDNYPYYAATVSFDGNKSNYKSTAGTIHNKNVGSPYQIELFDGLVSLYCQYPNTTITALKDLKYKTGISLSDNSDVGSIDTWTSVSAGTTFLTASGGVGSGYYYINGFSIVLVEE